jgi:hypothetical protein
VFVGGAQFLDGWWPLVPLVAVLALLFVAEAALKRARRSRG